MRSGRWEDFWTMDVIEEDGEEFESWDGRWEGYLSSNWTIKFSWNSFEKGEEDFNSPLRYENSKNYITITIHQPMNNDNAKEDRLGVGIEKIKGLDCKDIIESRISQSDLGSKSNDKYRTIDSLVPSLDSKDPVRTTKVTMNSTLSALILYLLTQNPQQTPNTHWRVRISILILAMHAFLILDLSRSPFTSPSARPADSTFNTLHCSCKSWDQHCSSDVQTLEIKKWITLKVAEAGVHLGHCKDLFNEKEDNWDC